MEFKDKDEALEEIKNARKSLLSAQKKVELGALKFEFFLGVIVGIAGNFIVSYYFQYQLITYGLPLWSLGVGIIAWLSVIAFLWRLYSRASEAKIEAQIRVMDLIEKLNELQDMLEDGG